MRSTRRRVILTMLLGAAGSAVAPRAALATLISPARRVRRYKPVGTVLWLDNWLYRVITPNDGVACVPVRALPTWLFDRDSMVPTVSVIVRYDIHFLDQSGGDQRWGVDAQPGHRTEALRLLYRSLAERDLRIVQLLPLELPPSAAMISR